MLMTGLQNTEDLGSSHQVLQWHPPTVTFQNSGTPDINTKFVNMHNTPPNAFWNHLWCIDPSDIHHDVGHPKVGMNIHVFSHSIALTCFRWVELTLKDPISTRPSSALEIIRRTYWALFSPVCKPRLGFHSLCVSKQSQCFFPACQTIECGSCHSDSIWSQKFEMGGTCHRNFQALFVKIRLAHLQEYS